MKKPEKKYYSIDEIAEKWGLSDGDLLSFAEQKKLSLCVKITKPCINRYLNVVEMKAGQRVHVSCSDLSLIILPIASYDVFPFAKIIRDHIPEHSQNFSSHKDGKEFYFGCNTLFCHHERCISCEYVITNEEKKRAEMEWLGTKQKQETINPKQRTTWLNIIFLLLMREADKRPAIMKPDGTLIASEITRSLELASDNKYNKNIEAPSERTVRNILNEIKKKILQ